MTRPILRLLILLACAAVALQTVVLWSATGRAAFTRHFDEGRAQREAGAPGESLADLFEGTGLNDDAGEIETTPNRFALGLLPSTYPWAVWDKHFASVATIAGPAAFIALLTLWPRRRGARRAAGD